MVAQEGSAEAKPSVVRWLGPSNSRSPSLSPLSLLFRVAYLGWRAFC